jgi:hypothetical protein
MYCLCRLYTSTATKIIKPSTQCKGNWEQMGWSHVQGCKATVHLKATFTSDPYVATSHQACAVLCHAVQWVTHAFCHANWGHLSMNLFNLCVFGKVGSNKSDELACLERMGVCIQLECKQTGESTCVHTQRGQHQLLDASVLYLYRVTHTLPCGCAPYCSHESFQNMMCLLPAAAAATRWLRRQREPLGSSLPIW